MDVISSGTARIDSREASNIQQGHQQQQQELTTRTLSNSCRNNRNITDVNSKRETSNSKDARNIRANNSNSISRDTNSTIWMPTTHGFHENAPKSLQISKKFVKKMQKIVLKKFPIYFSKSDIYRTFGSSKLLVQ